MKIIRSITFGVVLCLFFSATVQGQKSKKAKPAKSALPTADALIDRYLTVSNARRMCGELSSVKTKGYLDDGENNKIGTFASYKTNSGKARVEIKTAEYELVQIYDGQTGSLKETGKNWAEDATLKQSVEMYNFCYDFKSDELHPERAVKKIVDIEGAKTYPVAFSKNGKLIQTVYFEIKTGLILRWDSTDETDRQTRENQVYFGDYREVEGFLVPFAIGVVNGEAGMIMEVEEYLLNVQIDEAKYTKTD